MGQRLFGILDVLQPMNLRLYQSAYDVELS